MNSNSNSVTRAILPTPSEMSLALEARLASLWERDAGGVRTLFPNLQAFLLWYTQRNGKL